MIDATTENAKQYSDSKKLAARARLNTEYTIAETDWFPWVAQHMLLHPGDKVLDIGCDPGWFWAAAINEIPEGIGLILVRFVARDGR